MSFFCVVSVDSAGGIGLSGGLPWYLPGELRYFARLTKKTQDPQGRNRLVMGRKTWESIPSRPLPHRDNVVLTRTPHYHAEGAQIISSLHELFPTPDDIENTFLIGGRQPIEDMFRSPLLYEKLSGIYLTRIHGVYPADVYLPLFPLEDFQEILLDEKEEDGVKMSFFFYKKHRMTK